MRLVGADQRAAAFLAHVDLAGVIGGIDDFFVPPGKFRDVLGDQVVMLHREHRQLDADQVADLARPQARAIDDVLGMHRAFVGRDIPRTVAALRERKDARESFH